MPLSGTDKALFILNPRAGVIPVNQIISRELAKRKYKLSCYKSLSIDESGSKISQNFDKFEVFVAAGGDGTVHTVASKLIGTEKILGVLPIGSGNGFAKELGFKTKIKSLIRDIDRNESLYIDVIEINNDICLNVAGVGLDSFVSHSFDKLMVRGFWSYVGATIVNFIKLRPFHVTIKIAGEETISEDLFLLSIANTRQFGYYAYIAPGAIPNDGKMDLVLIKPFPKILSPLFVYWLFTKKLYNSRYVRHLETDKEVSIYTDETRYHIDGEPVTISGEITVRIKKRVLKVLKTKYLRDRIKPI